MKKIFAILASALVSLVAFANGPKGYVTVNQENISVLVNEESQECLAGFSEDMLTFFEETLEEFYYWRKFALRYELKEFATDLAIEEPETIVSMTAEDGEEFFFTENDPILVEFFYNGDASESFVSIMKGDCTFKMNRRDILNAISEIKGGENYFSL